MFGLLLGLQTLQLWQNGKLDAFSKEVMKWSGEGRKIEALCIHATAVQSCTVSLLKHYTAGFCFQEEWP